MAQRVMTDQVGVRFGIGTGVLFALTPVVTDGRLHGGYGVGLLLLVSTLLAVTMDRRHALVLGLAAWAFATGFAVNALGLLTFTALDLLRLAVFVLAAVAASRSDAAR